MSEILINNLFKKFKEKSVLRGINVKFEPGKIYGLLGNNGAGKTTLMRTIFNMVKPDSGNITFNGLEQKDIDYTKWFYFTETDTIPTDMTVKDYLVRVSFLANMKRHEFKERLANAFKYVTVDFSLKKRIKKLSSGQQKIMNCLALLVVNPEVIFLDEPTANMDVKNQKIVLDIIKKMQNPNRIIVITTHLIREISDTLTDVVILDQGKIKYDKALKKSDNLSEIFNKFTTSEALKDDGLEGFLNEDNNK